MTAYLVTIFVFFLISLLLAQSFNLAFGLGRLFNLAHISSYAIGAYSAAILTLDYGQNPAAAVVLGAILSAALSLLVGGVSLRLSDDHFAVGTLAFSALICAILINWRSLTKGVLGISGIPRPIIWGVDAQSDAVFATGLSIIVLALLWAVRVIFSSSFGAALKAQGESPAALAAIGTSSAKIKMTALAAAAVLASVAGSAFAFFVGFIDPSSFNFAELSSALAIVILGGPGSFWGAIFGAVLIAVIPEALRFVDIPDSILGPGRQIIFAMVIFSVLLMRRGKAFRKLRRV